MPLRPATEADLATVIELIHALAEYEREPDAVRLDPEELSRHLFGPRPYAEVLLAEAESGENAGFALFFHNFSTWEGKPGVHLEDLFVRPGFRGQGYGRALLAAVASIAVERGCARLEWAVLDWNEPAIGFYRRLGASALDEWTTYRVESTPLEALAAVAAEERA
ncbi:MAG: N-acetyltransferase family protein [Dehalococcoidia bacterium]